MMYAGGVAGGYGIYILYNKKSISVKNAKNAKKILL